MKVYCFELKKQLAGALIWAVVIAAVLWLMLYGFYPIFLDSRQAIEGMLEGFPPGFAEAFGFNLDDIFSFESFSGMVYLYESVIGAIMASVTAISVFAREKRSKCADFLFTRPLSRNSVFLQKLLCCLTMLIIVNIPYLIIFARGYRYYEADPAGTDIVLSALCLPLTQLVFTAFGIFAAVFMKRVRSASGLGTVIGIFAFMLSMIYSLTEKEYFKFISPLFYFSPNSVAETGGYDLPCVVVAAVLTVGLTAAAYVKYVKADVTV